MRVFRCLAVQRPSRSAQPLGPLFRRNSHTFTYRDGAYAINDRFERTDEVVHPEGRASIDRIALYHYVVKCGLSLDAGQDGKAHCNMQHSNQSVASLCSCCPQTSSSFCS